MAFVKKTWKDRIVQYANRRLLTKSGGEVEQVTVTRDEGTISEAGDQFNASNMNNLENRIDNAIVELTNDKLNISDWIKEGTNYTLNDMRTKGLYCGTFTDSPVSQSNFGFVIVSYLPNTNFVYQQFVGQKWNGDFGIYARTSADASTWNAWKNISGSKIDVKSQITFSENITGTNTKFFVKDSVLYIFYQGESKAHANNDALFTLPSALTPSGNYYFTAMVNQDSYGIVELAGGVCKLWTLNHSATGRVYFTAAIPLN